MNTKTIIFDEKKMGRFMNDRDDYPDSEKHTKKYNYTWQQKLAYAMWLKYCIYADFPEESKDKAVRSTLETFCEQKDSGFDRDVDYNTITNIIKETNRRHIWSDAKVKISNNEWNQICGLDDENARRFYFICLVIAKFYREINKDNLIESTDKRYKIGVPPKVIAKYARICIPGEKDYLDIWKKLYESKLAQPFEYYMKKKLQHKDLLLQSEYDIKPEDVKMEVIPCESMILYYINQYQQEFPPTDKKPKRIGFCKSCNEPYDEGLSSKYCPICTATHSRERKHVPCAGGCGKILDLNINERKKYCPECKKKKQKERNDNLHRKGSSVKICVDCGREFEASPKSKTDRCTNCQKLHRQTYKTEWKEHNKTQDIVLETRN